ncbi:MAG TPA: efflux transporter outer membrane subunit, partial [Blastocatellia bacterium]
ADTAAPPDQTSLGDLKWFQIFKDPKLQDLIRTALVQNYDVRQAVDREFESRANLGITRSNQLPQISGGANFTSTALSEQGQFVFPPTLPPGFFIARVRNFGTLMLNLASFEVDIWGKLRRATEAARANLLASEDARKAVIVTLVGDVSTNYFDLLELDSELEIAKRTLATRQESLRLIKLQQQNGVASTLDVRQGEELVYTAAVAVPNIELEIEQTENAIHLLLGEDPGAVARGRALVDQEQPPWVPAGLPSKLLERRPDIQAAEQNLIAANANIGVARAQYFPDISLTGFLGSEASQLAKFLIGPTTAWNFVPQVTQPIFNGGRIKSNVKLAQAEHEEMLALYEKSIHTAFSEVSDSLVQVRKIREVRIQQELLVAAVRDRARLSYMRYRGGVDTLLNALDADRELFSNELLLAQDRRNEMLALVQLYKALGGGWQQ